MAAVAYTSQVAARDFYKRERQREEMEVKTVPQDEKKEIRDIFREKGFQGKQLGQLVDIISSNKKAWVDFMMQEELHLAPVAESQPVKAAAVVGLSSFAGSVIPLIPFFFIGVKPAMLAALGLAIATLFTAGAIKGKLTVGSWVKAGITMALIGAGAALAGYAVGAFLGVQPLA